MLYEKRDMYVKSAMNKSNASDIILKIGKPLIGR